MATPWKVSELWLDSDAYVIGAGPSLKSLDTSRLAGRNTIACNHTTFEIGAPLIKIAFFSDRSFFAIQANRERLEAFPGMVFTNSPHLFRTAEPKWLLGLPRVHEGLHRTALGFGSNSGCGAVNLALILGARRVFLLGMDCRQAEDGATHWDGRAHNSKNSADTYRAFLSGWRALHRDLPRVFPGREIINATPGSAIDLFPRCTYAEAGLD